MCLRTLDSLLRHILSNSKSNTHRDSLSPRRLSDPALPFAENDLGTVNSSSLLGSIARCTERITLPISSLYLRRCESSPALATLRDVKIRLDSYHQQRNDMDNSDYQLACALAALLSNVYKLLEGDNQSVAESSAIQDHNNMLGSLRDEMLLFRMEHSLPRSTTSEQASLWEELNRLMDVVAALASDRPPKYDDAVRDNDSSEHEAVVSEKALTYLTSTSEKLPAYDEQEEKIPKSGVSNDDKARRDLESLLNVMERVSNLAPRLNNQRVELSERQAREMAALAIGNAIEKASGRRLNEQRASLKGVEDSLALKQLIQQISKSAERSLGNQRAKLRPVSTTSELEQVLDPSGTSETEYQLLNEVASFVDKLSKPSFRSRFNKQRYQLSSTQERDIFINNIVKKVDRLQHCRLDNQDAILPHKIQSKHDSVQEFFGILERVQSTKKQFDNQRATLSSTTPCNTNP